MLNYMTIKSMPNFSQSLKAILKAARALICLFAVNLAGFSGASMQAWADDRLSDKAVIGSNKASLNQASVKALHPDERVICQDLSQCADILSRHDAQAFDYQLLAEAFQSFGDEGALQLLEIAAGKDLPMALRSYAILTRPHWRYNLELQNRVIKRWQAFSGEQDNQQEGSSTRLAAHRTLMQTIASLPMREHFIAGLNHRRGDIAYQSRLGLKNLPPAILSAPVSPRLRAPLLKAATTQATPEILGLITALPKTQTRPIFLQNLRSDDPALIEAAFAGLSRPELNPELNSAQVPDSVSDTVMSVLRNMFQTAPDVVDSKTQAHIFAFSHFLQARHRHDLGHNLGHDLAAGGDGQYLRYAHSVLGDDTMPAAAHMAALDAILLSAPIKGKTLPDNKLPDNEIVITALQNLLKYRSMPVLYYVKDLHKKVSPQHHAQFLLLFWQNINLRDAEARGTSVKTNNSGLYVDDRASIMRQAARHQPSQEGMATYNSLLEQGLNYGKAKDQKRHYQTDWRVPYYAAIALMRFSGVGLPYEGFSGEGFSGAEFKAKLEQLADHNAIIGVQAAARLALKSSSETTGNFNPKALAQIQEGLLKDTKSCPVKAYDFSDQTIQMPYFDRGLLPELPDILPPLLKPLNQVLPRKDQNLLKSTAKPQARAALRYGLRAAHPVHLRRKVGADNGQNRTDMRNGWLAGYNFTDHDPSGAKRGGLKKDSLKNNAPDKLGGLIFYDNKSGDSETILAGNILAIIPKRANPPSDMTQNFWVIITRATAAERFSAKAAANIAEIEISHKSIKVQFQGRLPAIPTAINYRPEQAVAETHSGIKAGHQIEFGFDRHPALKFDAKNGFRRLCPDP